MSIYDLHTHSNCSDGSLSPEQLVQAAAEAGVSHIALTDHDTIDGVSRAIMAARHHQLECITGIEFSCQWRNRAIHVVGLNVDIAQSSLIQTTKSMAQKRIARNIEISHNLSKLGFSNCLEGATKFANGGQVGRPHFAQHLVDLGVVKNVNQAFKRYLGAGKAGDVKHQWPEMADVIHWIDAAGGVAVIAHPLKYQMTRTKMVQLCKEFKIAGGHAVEIVSGCNQSKQQTQDLASISAKVGLKGSIGSDFHHSGVSWQAIGRCGQLPASVDPVWSLWS